MLLDDVVVRLLDVCDELEDDEETEEIELLDALELLLDELPVETEDDVELVDVDVLVTPDIEVEELLALELVLDTAAPISVLSSRKISSSR